jgi:hypothetical protein
MLRKIVLKEKRAGVQISLETYLKESASREAMSSTITLFENSQKSPSTSTATYQVTNYTEHSPS